MIYTVSGEQLDYQLTIISQTGVGNEYFILYPTSVSGNKFFY